MVINNNLEQRVIGVINEHKKQNNDKGVISGRLTAKKLQVFGTLSEAPHLPWGIFKTVSPVRYSYPVSLAPPPVRVGVGPCEVQATHSAVA